MGAPGTVCVVPFATLNGAGEGHGPWFRLWRTTNDKQAQLPPPTDATL